MDARSCGPACGCYFKHWTRESKEQLNLLENAAEEGSIVVCP